MKPDDDRVHGRGGALGAEKVAARYVPSQNGVAVIACGHLHVYRRMEYRGIEIVWAPATSFFNILEKQHRGLGVPRAGYVEWTLEGPLDQSSAGRAAVDDHA